MNRLQIEDLTRITVNSAEIILVYGTYFYAQKFADFGIPKGTYSGQKDLNLIKELVFAAPDGRLLDFFGLFLSNGSHNDERLYNISLRRIWDR